jgi:hypothetical protein
MKKYLKLNTIDEIEKIINDIDLGNLKETFIALPEANSAQQDTGDVIYIVGLDGNNCVLQKRQYTYNHDWFLSCFVELPDILKTMLEDTLAENADIESAQADYEEEQAANEQARRDELAEY